MPDLFLAGLLAQATDLNWPQAQTLLAARHTLTRAAWNNRTLTQLTPGRYTLHRTNETHPDLKAENNWIPTQADTTANDWQLAP